MTTIRAKNIDLKNILIARPTPVFASSLIDLSQVKKGEWVKVETDTICYEATANTKLVVKIESKTGTQAPIEFYIDKLELYNVGGESIDGATGEKNADYYEGKGRIAISSDGNKHDNDDMLATKMTLMILAKAGLQDQTTVYTYADHIWESEDNDLEYMRQSAEGGGQRFGFNNCNFIAAVEDPEAAYEAMAGEIIKSTPDDPLFIIAAGPMHVIGTALDKANKITPNALSNVTVISHSSWNDAHSDKYETNDVPHGKEDPHSGWTWNEMIVAFGTKVNFKHISDQNESDTQKRDRFHALSWDSWNWMRDHKDPNIQWVYEHDDIPIGRPDYSDAGIAYYLVADLDSLRGDENGNPEKLQQWLGTEIIPAEYDQTKVWGVKVSPSYFTLDEIGDTQQLSVTITPSTATDTTVTYTSSNTEIATVSNTGLVTAIAKGNAKITITTNSGAKKTTASVTVGKVEAGDVTVGGDFIAFEANATKSDLGSNWVLRTPDDELYSAISGAIAPINETFLEYIGGSTAGTGVAGGVDMLQYRFTPKTDGAYTLTGRMAQRLALYGAPWDQCNDIYIKMEGDFESGTSTVDTESLKNWKKYFGRGKDTWGSFTQMDKGGHQLERVVYQLKKDVEYVFSISARSKGVCIDYFVLSKAPMKIGENQDLAVVNEERLRPGGDVTYVNEEIKAIEFERFTNMGSDFVDAKIDATRQCLQVEPRLKWCAAETTYKGESGMVNASLKTLLESDGESTFRVFINGNKICEFTNPRIQGTATKDYTIHTRKLNTDKFEIKTGDLIRVEFNSATNGLVPEGSTTATSRGRWSSIIIHTSEQAEDADSGIAPELHQVDAPTLIKLGATTAKVSINYSTTKPLDIEITMHDITEDNNWITTGLARTHTGLEVGEKLTKDVDITFMQELSVGRQYRWVLYFTNPGGTWKDGYPATHVLFTVSADANIDQIQNVCHIQTTFDQQLHIESQKQIKQVRLINLAGNTLSNKQYNTQKIKLDTQDINAGIYILQLHFNDGSTLSQKVIKRK